LHQPSEERVAGAPGGDHLLGIFKQLVAEAEEMACPCLDLLVTYIEESDEFVDGTYVPELHLIVRKVDDSAD